MAGLLWVFGLGLGGLAIVGVGGLIDDWRGKGDQLWANRLAVVTMSGLAAIFLWASFTGESSAPGPDIEREYRASPGSRY